MITPLASRYPALSPLAAGAAGSAFTPPESGKLSVWFDPDQESFSNGDAVGTLTDFSGNSNDAVQTLSARPTFLTSQVNGHPALSFDGTNQKLLLTSALTFASGAGFHLFMLVNPDNLSNRVVFSDAADTTLSRVNSTSDYGLRSTTGAFYTWSLSPSLATGSAYLLEVYQRSTTATILVGGSSVGTTTVAAWSSETFSLDRLCERVSGQRWDGLVGEVLIYSLSGSDLSAASLSAIRAHYTSKYGV